MKYRPLGKTGLEVSEIGLGAWQIGGALKAYFEGMGWISHGWGEADDDDSIRLIEACGDAGVNFIDTAAGYGAGHSEEVVGRAVKGARDRWVIETKGGEGFTREGVNWKNFSRQTLLKQIDESLNRLDIDCVDIYLLHSPSQADTENGGCLDALQEIKQSGKARTVGASIGSPEMGLDLIARGAVEVLQVPISIVDTRMASALIPAALEAGVGIVARGAFGAGFFTGQVNETTEFSPDDRRSGQSEGSKKSRAATADAFRFLEVPGRSLAQSYLKYLLSFDGISTVIPGSKTLAHMLENAAASDAPDLTQEELGKIAEARSRLGRKPQ